MKSGFGTPDMEMVDSSPLNSRAKISPGWCQLIRAQVTRTVGMPMDGRLLWGACLSSTSRVPSLAAASSRRLRRGGGSGWFRGEDREKWGVGTVNRSPFDSSLDLLGSLGDRHAGLVSR